MKINYVAESIIPSRAANSVHVMKMCEALAMLGHKVVLFVPKYHHNLLEETDDVYKFYKVKPLFKIIKIPWFKFKGSKYLYSILLAFTIWLKRRGVIYSRDFYTSVASVYLGLDVIHEFHRTPIYKEGLLGEIIDKFYKSRYLKKIVVISDVLKQIFVSEGFKDTQLLVSHDAGSIPINSTKIELKTSNNVGYLGHLYKGKGMEIIKEVAALLPKVNFHVIGGNIADINYWKTKQVPVNIHFHGFIPQEKISKYLSALDIYLLPNQKSVNIWGDKKVDIGAYTSPLKLFDYMGHKKPIIVSNISVLREVLNESNAIFCDPEKPEDWAQSIEFLLANPEHGTKLASKAFEDFKNNYTWNIRAKYILDSVFNV